MLDDNFTIRKLRIEDDLPKVSELIYLTDEYIYPELLTSKLNARIILPEIIKSNSSFLCLDNIYVAITKDEIIGIAVVLNENVQWCEESIDEICRKHGLDIPKGWSIVSKGYMEKLYKYKTDEVRYISNVCVDVKHRRKGVASTIINYIENESSEKLSLHVLVDNIGAVEAYKKQGFVVMLKEEGYGNLNGKKLWCYYMEKLND